VGGARRRRADGGRQTELRQRAEAARRALDAARAAEAAWRKAQDGNGETGVPILRTTEPEFLSLAPEETSPEVLPPPVFDEPLVPVLTRTTLPPFEPAVASTDPMGQASPEEDTLVRMREAARGQTDPFAPGARGGTDPYAPAPEVGPGQTDPYAQVLRRTPLPGAGDELPTPPATAFELPPAAPAGTPPPIASEPRTPPGGIMLEDELVLEPEALAHPDAAPTPPAGSLVAELSEALRRAGSEAPPELFAAPSTEAVGSKTVERGPLRLGPDAGDADADLWKLVSGQPAEPPSSFEAALRQVDGQLESLAGLRDAPVDPENPSTVALPTADLDALVRASFEGGEWTLAPDAEVTPPGQDSGRIALAALSGTPAPAPPELSASRRMELLRQARAAAEREPVASIPTPPPRSLEDAELAEDIEARHAALSRDPDRFAVLGLSHDAGRDEVKRAFIELAKRLHPDRLPRSLLPLQPKAARVFDAIREAQEFLLDDVRRAEHAAARAGSAPAGPHDPAAASEALVAGEMAMRRREYAQAEVHFRQAYAADPRPATRAAEAWAVYMDPSRRSEASRARAMMIEALKADPDCDRAHYQLGVIARVEGDAERAERHFREAVRSNPRHLEAAQELRLLEMRRRPKKR